MSRLRVILLGCVLAGTAGAHADDRLIEPGQWKVTSTNIVNGAASPPQAKTRCISPEQADDVARTFGPVSGTINSNCDAPETTTTGRTLNWRLQCRGQLDMDVVAHFEFDSPQRYTATITSQGRMAGAVISDVKAGLIGERVGDCPQ
jgi:hypothetical protein